jgi:hypothetical protein
MKLSRVPVNMYKKMFIILLCVFVGVFVLEFVASMLGNPIGEITINDVEIIPESPLECLLNATITSLIVGGIVNVFLTIRIIKEALGLSHWPAAHVVLMTLLFPFELLIGALFVIPNIIIFGLKGRIKNRAYEVEF